MRGIMAVRVLLVLVAFAVLYGCGQASSPVERQALSFALFT
jgi:hypothetical protein